MSQQVLSLDLSSAKAKKLIAEIIKDSNKILFSPHASKRMKQRKITATQVLCCLKHGHIVEAPYRDIKTADWRLTLETVSAGDIIKVAIAFHKNKMGEVIVVVTVI